MTVMLRRVLASGLLLVLAGCGASDQQVAIQPAIGPVATTSPAAPTPVVRAQDSLLPAVEVSPAPTPPRFPELRPQPPQAVKISAAELKPHRSSRPNWRCDEWIPQAVEVGWPEEELAQLSYVIYRESRCDPGALNSADPTRIGSLGLNQINGFWCLPSKYWPDGWLQAHGILIECDELYDPVVNLRAAYAIWLNSGWSPWGF